MKKEHLKEIQIVCRNKNDVKKCIKILEQIGLEQVNNIEIYDENLIVAIGRNNNINTASTLIKDYTVYFFNKTLIKMLNNIIKEEKLEDFEVASDGRITKINNWESEKCLYFIGAWDYGTINFDGFKREGFEYYIKLGLVYATEEARDKAKFKLEIENQLKNIAERLNDGEKVDWENYGQCKYSIYCKFINKEPILGYHYSHDYQGIIHCLSDKFLDEAKKEIGEENLIKYFKGE